ncbi:hypothetical protein M422DRAFT_33552 [Sphaerobolus stellatus SS14]|uniref:Actin-like ATPase domain-containing protein n=1 Tax=Sphaerobolus stellatus (strain SS14) TaxID=990650 RepID=A0A0C9U4F6_SPHS4|nr:hypothetical protein M422DRAFT_33552 [Sphaerobolus stellatus SS14]
MSVPNGTPEGADARETVIGINFGNTFASIAVITKEGKAECIANEDGERQIASAISFHGEEILIGNQATPQLVKNSKNTIANFRNFIGKKFSEIPASAQESPTPSAPIIQHPSLPDTPAYAVEVTVPAPSPLPKSGFATSNPSSKPSTTNPTPLGTPASEPTIQTRHVTVHEVATIFFKSLLKSASDFLGKAPRGVVLTVPSSFNETQKAALLEVAKEAGANVLELVDEETAAASLLVDANSENDQGEGTDRTTLLVDWGATDLTISLLSVRAGLVHVLGSKNVPDLGTSRPGSIDEILIKFFAKEFTKKTGEALQVCPPTSSSARAQTKIVLALPHVKRSLTSATTSTKSTQLSVESLYGGIDFNAPLNRTRASSLFAPVFSRLSDAVKSLLESIDGWKDKGIWVDSIAWVGGGGCVGQGAGASTTLISAGVLGEDVQDEVLGAPEEVLSRGSALHALGLISLSKGYRTDVRDVRVTTRTIGIIIPSSESAEDNELGGQWIPTIVSETAIPARRTVVFAVDAAKGALPSSLPLEIWEATETVDVRVISAEVYSDAEEDEEPAEPTEERERGVKKEAYLGTLTVALSPAEAPKKGKKQAKKVEVKIGVSIDGAVEAAAREEGKEEWVKLLLAAPST